MPCLSKLKASNLVPVYIEGIKDRYVTVNNYNALPSYCHDLYSKCIIRIPQNLDEEISIYPYPTNGTIGLSDMISLFTVGKVDEKDTPRSDRSVSAEREYIRECNFTAFGSKMKVLLYDKNHDQRYSSTENERAKAVFMARDERVFRMAGIKNKPKALNFITNHLFSNSVIGTYF